MIVFRVSAVGEPVADGGRRNVCEGAIHGACQLINSL